MKIRSATWDDLPELTNLWQERMVIISQSDSRVRLNPSERDAWLLRMNNRITDHASAVFVAEQGSALTGYIIGYLPSVLHSIPASGYGIVEEIALDAHTYHGGLARLLYSAISTWFSESNVIQILIYTPCYYAVEQAFWRGLGAKVWKPPAQDTKAWHTAPEYVWLTL